MLVFDPLTLGCARAFILSNSNQKGLWVKSFWVPYSPVENSTAVRTNYLWVFGDRHTHSCGETHISVCETLNAKPKYFAVSYDASSYSVDLPHFHCMFKQYVFNSTVLYLWENNKLQIRGTLCLVYCRRKIFASFFTLCQIGWLSSGII